jgi:hypothetical protein
MIPDQGEISGTLIMQSPRKGNIFPSRWVTVGIQLSYIEGGYMRNVACPPRLEGLEKGRWGSTR